MRAADHAGGLPAARRPLISPTVSAGDFKNVASLVAKFIQPANALSDFIGGKLPPSLKKGPAKQARSSMPSEPASRQRSTDRSRPIPLRRAGVCGVNLRPSRSHLLEQKPSGHGAGPPQPPPFGGRYSRRRLCPERPIQSFSDSQLVTLQVAGLWHAKDKMQSYCVFLRKMRKTYLYDLTKISRADNQIADSLAQKYILKNSGRCMSLDHGRFNVIKQDPRR